MTTATMAATDHRESGNGLFAWLASRLAAARFVLIVMLMAVSLAVGAIAGWRWLSAARDNATIRALLAGDNVEIDPVSASSKVLFARLYYLLKRDRIDEAQIVLDQARFRADPDTRVFMLYDMANARLRVVFDAIEQGQFDKATSLIGLAKDEYVDALRVDPRAWDVKYNLDVASRLLRDLPEGQGPEDNPREAPKELWTDIPGVPKGEP
jgi:mxaK protein